MVLRAIVCEIEKLLKNPSDTMFPNLSGRSVDDNGNEDDIDFDEWNRLELGAHLGAGIGVGPLVIDVRYLLGISNLANDLPDDAEIRNTGFGAGVSLLFGGE